MAVQDRAKLVTAEELLAMPEGDVQRELVRGVIIEMSPSGRPHGRLSSHVARLLDHRSKAYETGEVTVEGAGYILSRNPDTVRAPDVGYISNQRLKGISDEGYYSVAPDLAIEIASPNDKAQEIQEKVLEFLQAGTQLVVVLMPKLRVAVVHTGTGSHTIDETGVLDLSAVLPGLTLPVRDIFAVLDEKPADDDGNPQDQ